MNKVVISVDLEEWYHLDYLQKYKLDKQDITVPKIYDFLDLLDKYGIKSTFFILGELAIKYKEIISDIVKRGHEIASHGCDHTLLHKMTTKEFTYDIEKSKDVLESVSNTRVMGYRAPCFSLNNEKLSVLRNSDYKYDSSYIQFSGHPLYGKLDLNEFEKKESLIYETENLYEFELPTKEIFNRNIPISGGGYLRLFPNTLNKTLIRNFIKINNNFFFYLHPFELTSVDLPFTNNISNTDKFRASVGRKKNYKKLEQIIKMLKRDLDPQFTNFKEIVDSGRMRR